MLLSDTDLVQAMHTGELGLSPYHPDQMQPASYDLLLSDAFRSYRMPAGTLLDPRQDQEPLTELLMVSEGQNIILPPHGFMLGCTVDSVSLGSGLAARFEGKSSLGRLGLMTHSTAGFIDPGFHGQITLELCNASGLPIALWPGMRIGQLCVLRLSSPCTRLYGSPGLGSRYQGNQGPAASRSSLGPS